MTNRCSWVFRGAYLVCARHPRSTIWAMALKKSDLYASLWASCDELRNAMEPAQYKNYVLVMLFIKYVSDKYAGTPFAPITIGTPTNISFTP